MRRITFIENRGKTAFWARVAQALTARGHQITWIVQNPLYASAASDWEMVLLPFPQRADLKDLGVPEPVAADRGRSYFGAGQQHYAHYQSHIQKALDRLKPDFVIGETTLFHELLTVSLCRARGIPYLHPTMNRYPHGRFMIFAEDTQIPAARSGETLDPSILDRLAEVLARADNLPSYMQVPGPWERRKRQLRRLTGQARVTLGRWRGERYNTPSLACKLVLTRGMKANMAAWRKLARAPAENGPVILYPLQMQPEANIDVWGRPYSNQVAFIERLLAALPPEGQVAVKANPKTKYETSDDLLALAKRTARVVLLPLDWRMLQAHAASVGAVTVSGTVGYEAVFGRGRCMSLRHPTIEWLFPSLHAASPEEAVRRLLDDPVAGHGGPGLSRRLLAQLVSDSFPGTINEPAYDPDCLSGANITRVVGALERVFAAEDKRIVA